MNSRRLYLPVHVAVWLVIFLSPLMFMNHGEGISLSHFARMCVAPVGLMAVFYANYLWLTPRHLARGDRRFYFLANAVMIAVVGTLIHLWMESTRPGGHDAPPPPDRDQMRLVFFALRNMFNLAIAAAIATTIRLSMLWYSSETARREAEAARSQAELRNLRAQINPHFLLNTLNNIYALTEFDTPRAQRAIHRLSTMLRHVLYDVDQPYVTLQKEVSFIADYVALMKIRLAPNVDVRLDVAIDLAPRRRIAPLLFISLVENAFKHGVSTTGASHIAIRIEALPDATVCCIANSNHPKTASDRSGHGIGLQQVAKRLEILYPDAHQWTRGVDTASNEYTSKITIYDTQLCNN